MTVCLDPAGDHDAAIGLSVLVPVHNNADTLPELITRLVRTLEQVTPSYEILLLDDASTDASWSVILVAVAAHGEVKGLRFGAQVGQMGALVEATRWARGRWLICIDADLECRPEDVPLILQKLERGADVASATRQGVNARSPYRRVTSIALRMMVSRKVRRSLDDIGCGLKGWGSWVSSDLEEEWDGSSPGFIEHMIAAARRIENVDVRWAPSRSGSAYRLADLSRIGLHVILHRTARVAPERASGLILVGAMIWMRLARQMPRRGHGTLVVVSVALAVVAGAGPRVARSMIQPTTRPRRPVLVETVGQLGAPPR